MVKRSLAVVAVLSVSGLLVTSCSLPTIEFSERRDRGFEDVVVAPSPTPSAKPVKVTKPSRPVAVIARRTSRSVGLTWLAPRRTGGANLTYEVRISFANNGRSFMRWQKVSSRKRARFFVSPYSSYRLQVRAVNSAGKGLSASAISRRIAR